MATTNTLRTINSPSNTGLKYVSALLSPGANGGVAVVFGKYDTLFSKLVVILARCKTACLITALSINTIVVAGLIQSSYL